MFVQAFFLLTQGLGKYCRGSLAHACVYARGISCGTVGLAQFWLEACISIRGQKRTETWELRGHRGVSTESPARLHGGLYWHVDRGG